MSYCEIYAVNKEGDIHFYDEARNAWGGAMHIWTKLSEKYGKSGSLITGFDTLWKMYGGDVISERDNLVLGSTFDKAICQKERLPELIKAMESFNDEYPTPTLQKEIEIMKDALNDEDVIGIAWCQTSVSSFGTSLRLPEVK